jgi:hypothetical protein
MGTARFRTLVAPVATTTIFFATCGTDASEASPSNGLTKAQSAVLEHSPIFFDIGRRLH